MGIDDALFLVPPPESLICPYCVEVFEIPMSMCSSDHLACHACVTTWRSANRNRGRGKWECPSCREDISTAHISRSRAVERLIARLQVKCPKDCGWKGDCGDLRHHEQQPHPSESECYSCRASVPLMDRELHRLQVCPESEIDCPRGHGVCEPFLRKNSEEHLKVCDQFACSVSPECDIRTTSRNLVAHENKCRQAITKDAEVQEISDMIADLYEKTLAMQFNN